LKKKEKKKNEIYLVAAEKICSDLSIFIFRRKWNRLLKNKKIF